MPEPLYVLKPSSDHYRAALDSEVQRRAWDAEVAAWLLAEQSHYRNLERNRYIKQIKVRDWLLAEVDYRLDNCRAELNNYVELTDIAAWLLAESEWNSRVDARNSNLTAEEYYNKGYGAGFCDGFSYGRGNDW